MNDGPYRSTILPIRKLRRVLRNNRLADAQAWAKAHGLEGVLEKFTSSPEYLAFVQKRALKENARREQELLRKAAYEAKKAALAEEAKAALALKS